MTAALGAATAVLVVTQALLIADALAPVIVGTAGLDDVAPVIRWIAVLIAARVAITATQERFAHRSAARAVAELREQVLVHAVNLGPRWLASEGAGVVTLATRGLDALDPYFVRYLPQLLLAVTVTPCTLAVVAGMDWVAALTMACTLPLVPVFMWLIGHLTAEYADRRLAVMQRLGNQMLDLVTGIPTLQALGRHRGPAARVRRLGDAHRRATMGTLRVAFLSGMALELVTTLSVALVAVGIGFRLLDGGLDLRTGLAVLILAPEVYLPLRQVGAHFHASASGIAAADRAFTILATPVPTPGTLPAPDLHHTTVHLSDIDVTAPDRARLAPAGLNLTLRPGQTVGLAGPNGVGKSTAIAVVLGLLEPTAGTIVLTQDGDAPVNLAGIASRSWWDQITWVPQRPVFEPGTMREAVTRDRDLNQADLDRAASLTGLDTVLANLPMGWDSRIGQGGTGLSLGQRQQLALTRALVAPSTLVILDEPTAHLDANAQTRVLATLAALRAQGRTVLLAAHSPALLAIADQVVEVTSRAVQADPPPPRPTATAQADPR